MTKLLETVFAKVNSLPESEQDVLAQWLMMEVSSDEKWQALFAGSQDKLRALAIEALNDEGQATTQALDVDSL